MFWEFLVGSAVSGAASFEVVFCGSAVWAEATRHVKRIRIAAPGMNVLKATTHLPLTGHLQANFGHYFAKSGLRNTLSSSGGFRITWVKRMLTIAPFSMRFIRKGIFNPSTSR